MSDYEDDYDDEADESGEVLTEVRRSVREQKAEASAKPEKTEQRHDRTSVYDDPDWGKKSKLGVPDVEEALAKVRAKNGDPYPYRSGYGRTGKREADLVPYHEKAKQLGTTVGRAMRDYNDYDNLTRNDPVGGTNAALARMGHDPAKVAYENAVHHGFITDDNIQRRNVTAEVEAINNFQVANAVVAHEASHPANKWLREPAAQQWMTEYGGQKMPDGRPYFDHLRDRYPGDGPEAVRKRLRVVYEAFNKERLRYNATHRQNQRQEAMDAAARAEKSIYNKGGW